MTWIPVSLSVELGFQISILSKIPVSLSYIPDSKAQDSGFWIPRAKISRIPESVFPYMGRYKLSQKSVTSFRLFSKSNVALCTLVPLCSHLAFSFRQKKAEKGLLVSKFYVTRENGKSEKSLRRVGVPTVSHQKRPLL